jgi:hypothetical protein
MAGDEGRGPKRIKPPEKLSPVLLKTKALF